MKNKDLQFLSQNMKCFAGVKGIKINYAASKNKRKLEGELKELGEHVKELQLKHCEMKGGENAEPVIKDGVYKMKDINAFNEDYAELLEVEIEVDLHKIKMEDVPADVTGTQMDCILFFLDEPKEKPEKKPKKKS